MVQLTRASIDDAELIKTEYNFSSRSDAIRQCLHEVAKKIRREISKEAEASRECNKKGEALPPLPEGRGFRAEER
jgi:Arc/MetJ-type ribon-helix-helix transcriptional regulator